MQRYISILVLLTLINFPLISQTENNSLVLKLSPLSFVGGDLTTNSLAIGVIVEKKIKKSYSIQQEVSYIITDNFLPKGFPFTINVDKINGWKFDTEIKKYLSEQKESLEGIYVSPNVRLITTNAERNNTSFMGERLTYTVKRLSLASHLNLGWQSISEKRGLSFEFVIGAGYQYINSSANTDVTVLGSTSQEKGGIYDEGQKTGFSFRVDLRIGYAF